jgi:hypothetical protein
MAMIAWKAGGAPAELASGRDELRRQQQQALELKEMEREWGARIQALAGMRPASHGAARLQALDARPPKGPGPSFRAMRAAGEGRLQALVEKGASTGSEWDVRIGKVEKKYKELLIFAKEQQSEQLAVFALQVSQLRYTVTELASLSATRTQLLQGVTIAQQEEEKKRLRLVRRFKCSN